MANRTVITPKHLDSALFEINLDSFCGENTKLAFMCDSELNISYVLTERFDNHKFTSYGKTVPVETGLYEILGVTRRFNPDCILYDKWNTDVVAEKLKVFGEPAKIFAPQSFGAGLGIMRRVFESEDLAVSQTICDSLFNSVIKESKSGHLFVSGMHEKGQENIGKCLLMTLSAFWVDLDLGSKFKTIYDGNNCLDPMVVPA